MTDSGQMLRVNAIVIQQTLSFTFDVSVYDDCTLNNFANPALLNGVPMLHGKQKKISEIFFIIPYYFLLCT